MIKFLKKPEKPRALGEGLPACLSGKRALAFNTISGCPMECNYCKYRARNPSSANQVYVYTNLANQLSRELDALEGTPRFPSMVLFNTTSDAFCGESLIERVARDCLEVLLSRGIFVNLSTRGTLPAEVIEVLTRRADMVIVTYTIAALTESFQRVFEPRVPPAEDRLRMVKRLSMARIPVRGRIEPLIPMENDSPSHLEQLLSQFRKAGVSDVVTSYLQMDQAVAERLKQRTNRLQFSMIAPWFRDPNGALLQQLDREYRRRKYQEIKTLGAKYSIRVHVCACRNLDMFQGRCFVVPVESTTAPKPLL